MRYKGILKRSINLSSVFLIIFYVFYNSIFAAECIPSRPQPNRLVNDLANIFNPSQQQYLEQRLVSFNDSTSNQIVILTVLDLCGTDKADFAYQIGEKWGVGQKKFDNGIVILIKPKTSNENGEVFIATGYGLEGALPDATARMIVENEMIPHFKQNNYFDGVESALKIITSIASGEYSYKEYNKKNKTSPVLIIAIFIAVVILLNIFKRKSRGASSIGRAGSTIFWGSAGMHHGSWGNFSSGSGGFGGFGGGSFGGGGAGGSW